MLPITAGASTPGNHANHTNSLGKRNPKTKVSAGQNKAKAAADAAQFLELLGKDPARTYFRTIGHGKGANRSRRGADLHGFDPEALARDNQSGESVYFVTGNSTTATSVNKTTGKPTGCVWEGDVTSCPAFFAEWDDSTIEWQLQAWRELRLPEPTIQLLTGGKSVHCYWVLNEPMEPAKWRPLQARLIDHCGSDENCKEPNRLMRLPGFAYIDKKTGKPNGKVAEVVHTTGNRYSPQEIEACLPLLFTAPQAPPTPAPAQPTNTTNRPRPLEQIQAACAYIPERVVGGNTYEPCRRALCGCAAALAEIGLPEEQALDLLANKWPDRAMAKQALQSSTTREAKSFWAIASEYGFELRRSATNNVVEIGSKRAQDQQAQGDEQQEQAESKLDLEVIRDATDYVVAENINRSRPQYLHRLRELVEEKLSIPPRDDLYRREIGEAIIRRDGIECNPFIGGCELPDDDDEWLVDGLVMAGALNIVGADPKAGKTLFSVSLIASLLHGCGEFIGRGITGRPKTVIIVGPDQAVKLWKRQLRAVGLVEGNTLDPRIVRLWDSRNPWAATPEGIAELRQVCAENPGSLVLVDSFAKVSEKLGIDENSREAAEVLTDIERACIVHGCTPLVIHHNAKAAGRVGIVNGAALRGNGAIRANASQLLILTLIEPDNPKDSRRRLVTEGRGTEFIDSVIQLEDDGRGWRHVCEFSEHRSAAKVEKAREKLTARQAEALRALEGSDVPLTTAQVWAAAYPDDPWDKDTNECKQHSRTLGQLMDKRLVVRHPGTANRPTWSAA